MEQLLRQAMMRIVPLSPEEKEAFEQFNRLLSAKLDEVEEDIQRGSSLTNRVDELRRLLDMLPGLWP